MKIAKYKIYNKHCIMFHLKCTICTVYAVENMKRKQYAVNTAQFSVQCKFNTLYSSLHCTLCLYSSQCLL